MEEDLSQRLTFEIEQIAQEVGITGKEVLISAIQLLEEPGTLVEQFGVFLSKK